MGHPISIFSGYSQKENRVTNYCLLVLKMLYEENPKYLGEVLAALVGEDISSHIGVSFRQQERLHSGIPDGIIVQRSLRVHIETKNWDWFYDSQLEAHLDDLSKDDSGVRILLALGNFESEDPDRFEKIQAICREKYRGAIVFNSISFEDFIKKVQLDRLPKNLSDAITDFKQFLNEENLLPSWREWLDVVNCAGIPEDITERNVYMCPTVGGSYNHDRCRYFGMYRNKRVEIIAEIDAVVDVDLESNTELIKWRNGTESEKDYKVLAREKVARFRPDEGPTRVFLLGKLFLTDFRKDSSGGMYQSKRYFNIARLQAVDAEALAERLKGLGWSKLESGS